MGIVTRLLIENFQSHERTEIAFHPGLNVIVGPSDQGKSAIIRALRWVLFNEPRGGNFVRSGADYCQVTLNLDSGIRISRRREAKLNSYTLSQSDGTEQGFEGFGTTVPREITEAHGMFPVYLDADMAKPLNFSYQLDGPFLLSESGATKAKAIGRLIGVHVIDATLRQLLKDLTNRQQDERRLAETNTALLDRLQEYSDLPQLAALIARGETLRQLIQAVTHRLDQLISLQEKWQSLVAEASITTGLLRALSQIPQADQCQTMAARLSRLTGQLENAGVKLQNLITDREITDQNIAKTDGLLGIEVSYHQALSQSLLLSQLERYQDGLKQNTSGTAAAQRTLGGTESVPAIETTLLPRSRSLHLRTLALETAARQYQASTRELTTQRKAHSRLDGLTRAVDLWTDLAGKAARQKKSALLLSAYQENRRNRQAGYDYLAQLAGQTTKLAAAYREELIALGECPFCYNPIDPDSIERIMDELTREASTVHGD